MYNKYDFVQITNPGSIYPGYTSVAKELGMIEPERERSSYGNLKKGETAIILAVSSIDPNVFLIKTKKDEFLIEKKGFEIIKLAINETYDIY